jgi:predicted nucleotide-binding protein
MAKSRRSEPPQTAQLTVDVMRAAIPKLERRIKDLESFDVNTIRERWDPVMEALAQKVDGTLQEILGHGTVEYNEYSIHSLDTLPLIMGGGPDPLPRVIQGYREGIERAALKLTTLKELFEERLSDAPSGAQGTQSIPPVTRAAATRRVFVVHGRDDGAKETVARFVSRLRLEPIILHEQPSQGRTIIEKFEAHATVDYALVLLTPDDVGHPANDSARARRRARQNVILELGFFLGTLGRHRVCVLYSGDIEIPSDYQGVLYVPLDERGAWRLSVAREMKVAGVDVNLNDAM